MVGEKLGVGRGGMSDEGVQRECMSIVFSS